MNLKEWEKRRAELGVKTEDFDSPEYKERERKMNEDAKVECLKALRDAITTFEKKLNTIISLMWILIAVAAIVSVIVLWRGGSASRYHYRTRAGQMFDGKTGTVIDTDTGEVLFQMTN